MKVLLSAIGRFLMGCGAYVLAATLIFGISWLITCGIVSLICLCFGLAFDWLIATGIWLLLLLLRWIFTGGSK